MAIRFYRDFLGTGLDYYTAICDRCLRIGPTRHDPHESMADGGFIDDEELNGHAIILCRGRSCELAEHDAGATRRVAAEADLSQLWRKPTPTKATHTPTEVGCPACGYRPTSWDIIAGRGPWEPGKACPGCGKGDKMMPEYDFGRMFFD